MKTCIRSLTDHLKRQSCKDRSIHRAHTSNMLTLHLQKVALQLAKLEVQRRFAFKGITSVSDGFLHTVICSHYQTSMQARHRTCRDPARHDRAASRRPQSASRKVTSPPAPVRSKRRQANESRPGGAAGPSSPTLPKPSHEASLAYRVHTPSPRGRIRGRAPPAVWSRRAVCRSGFAGHFCLVARCRLPTGTW